MAARLTWRRVDPALVVCLLIAATEAVIVLVVISPAGNHTVLGGDGPEYWRYAINLTDHGAFSNALAAPFYPSVFRTPGYPLFLAFFRLITPGSLLLVRIAQFSLLGLTAVLTYRVALCVTSRRAAVASGVLCATYLPLVWLASYQLTEELATCLVVVVIWLVFRAQAQSTPGRYALIGVAAAALSLVRPEDGLVVAPIAFALFIGSRRSQAHVLRGIGALLVAFAVAMAPWTIRNALVAHRFLPLGDNSGQPLYISAQEYAGNISYNVWPGETRRLGTEFVHITGQSSPYASPLGGAKVEIAYNDEIQSAAMRKFGQLTVTRVVRSLPSRIEHLWGTADFTPPNRSFTAALYRIAVVQWALLILMAATGVVVTVRSRGTRIWPLLVFPIYTTVVHLVFNVEARFSVPDRPFVMIFAAVAAVRVLAAIGARTTRMTPISRTPSALVSRRRD